MEVGGQLHDLAILSPGKERLVSIESLRAGLNILVIGRTTV
jgi:hypothetical protein